MERSKGKWYMEPRYQGKILQKTVYCGLARVGCLSNSKQFSNLEWFPPYSGLDYLFRVLESQQWCQYMHWGGTDSWYGFLLCAVYGPDKIFK